MSFKIQLVAFQSRFRPGMKRKRREFPPNNFSSVGAVELPPVVVIVQRGRERVFVRRKAGA